MTSADVKATYDRIINPPEGVLSSRRALYEDITSVEAPDAHTVVFRFKAPNASALDGFASPWNCIYSAAKLKENPRYPETKIMGTGAFSFVEHVKGQSWEGKRFDGYFKPGQPYLDGYKAFFVKSSGLATGIIGGQFDIEFRGLTPADRDQIVDKLKDNAVVLEGPWSASLMLTINARKKPFDDIRVRQALTLAMDRWGSAPAMARISLMKYVGGFTRPGYVHALTDAELEALPGYGRDIAKSREEARRLLKEAGVGNLKINFLNRNVGQPYTAAGIYAIDQWSKIGIETEHRQLETKLFFDALGRGDFDVAIDFITDHGDDPNLQYVHVVSAAMQVADVLFPARRQEDRRAVRAAEARTRSRRAQEADPRVRAILDQPGLQPHAVLVAAHRRAQQARQRLAAHAQPLPRQRSDRGVARSVVGVIPALVAGIQIDTLRRSRKAGSGDEHRDDSASLGFRISPDRRNSTGSSGRRSRPSSPRTAPCP